MDQRYKEVVEQGEALFSKRTALMSYWQEVADNFYPERADFTFIRHTGAEFAAHLMTSYPIMVRRDLGNAFGSMLRRDEWFKLKVAREEYEDHDAKKWLEAATRLQRRAMYDRRSQFTRATAEADQDYAAFGQAVISVEANLKNPSLLYRCWHLKDVAWSEGYDGQIDGVYRKWTPTLRHLVQLFGEEALHPKHKAVYARKPMTDVRCMHAVVPGERYGDRYPWVSVYLDCENQHVMRFEPMNHQMYVIPRWQTVSGSQYAYSPATVAALPDSRLIQSMTEVLLSAGEKAVDPPMIAVQEAIRSDVNIRRGGITWVDSEYDERLGEVLRPMSQDKSSLPFGFEMQDRIRADIASAFYLNKLTLPIMAGDMTATEVSQRVEEYIRQSIPLFEPMEMEYNGQICDRTFEILMQNGAFTDVPRSLQGQEVVFGFESPIRSADDRKKGNRFREAIELTTIGANIDPTLSANIDFHTALRDSLTGIGVSAEWMRNEDQVKASIQQAAQMAQQAGAQGAAA